MNSLDVISVQSKEIATLRESENSSGQNPNFGYEIAGKCIKIYYISNEEEGRSI